MKSGYLAAAAIAAFAFHLPALAQRTPSAHVRCDGNPDNVTPGETAARLLGAVTLLGLFAPPPEASDHSQRLFGAEGVAICAQALDGESNDVRRAQLILATAIHRIEAGDPEAALADAHRVETDRPELASSMPFRHSLGLSAMEIEALALLGAGRLQEAQAKAFEMAAAAPYDLVASARALPFVRLTAEFGPAQELYYANLIRLYPSAVLERAVHRQTAGDFRGSTEDYALWMRLEQSVLDGPNMTLLAHTALAHALAGDVERAEEYAAQAHELLEAEPNASNTPAASEVLDLYRIWKMAHDGRLDDARLLFAARTSWQRPTAAAVSAVARLLQEGAPPEQLTGSLAGDPGRWVTELIERRREDLLEGKDRFAAIRGFFPQENYDRFARNVWREGRSRYFGREENERFNARFITVQRDGYGTPAGYALLLHAALTARREGQSSFMLMPLQANVSHGLVRVGNSGDTHLVEPLVLDAEQVIADLRPLIPPPARR